MASHQAETYVTKNFTQVPAWRLMNEPTQRRNLLPIHNVSTHVAGLPTDAPMKGHMKGSLKARSHSPAKNMAKHPVKVII